MASSVSAFPVQISCKGVLFDMDGILISSLGSVERSWTKWAIMRGLDPKAVLSTIHGRRSIESVARLRPDLDATVENAIIEQLEIDDREGIEALPGALALLRSLPSHCWTVVTSATEPLARVRLAAAGIQVPDRIVTAESVSKGKPDPAPYLAGAAVLGLSPTECVVFEDAASGARAGRAAGCTVIATPFSHPLESLSAAHYLVPDLNAVTAHVREEEQDIELKFLPLTG